MYTVGLAKDILLEVARNLVMSVPLVRRFRLRYPRSSVPPTGLLSELERYAFPVLRSINEAVGSPRDLHILEIGPGDHLASGLAVLAAGAASYTAMDRFSVDYAGEYPKHWYRWVQKQWPHAFPDCPWPAWLVPEHFPETVQDRVFVVRAPVESRTPVHRSDGYDLICSHFVGEHVSDVTAFAKLTARLLRQSGTAIHTIDFQPHECWAAYKNDPFLFLRFPDWLWYLMGSHRGTPNRQRLDAVRAAFQSVGLHVAVSRRKEFERPPFCPKSVMRRAPRLLNRSKPR